MIERSRTLLRDAWVLGAPYFNSEERWSARLLLGTIIALHLFGVAMAVLLNNWHGEFYNILQAKDWQGFVDLLLTYRVSEDGFMPGFTPIVAVLIPSEILRVFLRKILEIRWRRWMTEQVLDRWLAHRAYYTISLNPGSDLAGTDNPDQRVAEDVRDYVAFVLQLGIGLLSKTVSFISFAGILWSLSGPLELWGISIPGYMLWLALIYAGLGTWLTHLVGRKLVGLQFQQQRLEADFRYGLVRVRDNTEAIALSGGEAEERRTLSTRFAEVASNWMRLARRELRLDGFTTGYSQVSAIFPLVIAAPRYFSGAIPLGSLIRTAGAFGSVNDALSYFVDSYGKIAAWRSTVVRLAGFDAAIATAQALAEAGPRVVSADGQTLVATDLTLGLPDGTPLLEHAHLAFARGRSTVVTGRSGSGKSTLFRALAGIWPYGFGQIARPLGTYLFLPQRPYFPVGTLRRAITYPAAANAFEDGAIRAALMQAGLAPLLPDLDVEAPWAQRLSGGEQQRLSVARALLLRPDWLFMDEATASLDPEGEAELYRTLRSVLPDTTILSIAHRPAVAAFHDDAMVLGRAPNQPGRIEVAVSADAK